MENYLYQTPQPEYPHITHELNTRSHCFREATSFIPSACKELDANPHYHGSNVPKCDAVSNPSPVATTQLLSNDHATIDYSLQNHDCTGILFEYRDYYFTIMLAPPDINAKESVYRGWLEKKHIGIHLLCEWESIPKYRIGENCIVATGSMEGWWHIHSKTVMSLRTGITGKVRAVEKARQEAKNKVTDERFMAALNQEFGKVVDTVYAALRVTEGKKRAKLEASAETAMREFTLLEEQQ
jgi:hypothetical protein